MRGRIIDQNMIDSVNDGDIYCSGRAVIEKTDTTCHLAWIDTMTEDDEFVALRNICQQLKHYAF